MTRRQDKSRHGYSEKMDVEKLGPQLRYNKLEPHSSNYVKSIEVFQWNCLEWHCNECSISCKATSETDIQEGRTRPQPSLRSKF